MTTTELPSSAQTDARSIRPTERRHTNRWLIGLLVVLATALVAIVTWAITDRSNEDAAPEPDLSDAAAPQLGPADPATGRRIDSLLATTDGEFFASAFTDDAIFERYDQDSNLGSPSIRLEGREAIAGFWQHYRDSHGLERVGVVARWANFEAYAVKGTGPPDGWCGFPFSGTVIFELTADGTTISNAWVFGIAEDGT